LIEGRLMLTDTTWCVMGGRLMLTDTTWCVIAH